MKIISIGLGGISVEPDRIFKLRPDVVKELVANMKEVGQLTPIIVRRRGPNMGYTLIAGNHRLEAAKKLKWPGIDAVEMEGLDALQAERIEIYENIKRLNPTPSEEALCDARLKEIAEEEHRLKDGRPAKEKTLANLARVNPGKAGSNTARAIAKETGRSATAIDRNDHRVKKIPEIRKVVGTSLDKGVELDALAKLPPEKQKPLIERAAKGEKVSARPKTEKIAVTVHLTPRMVADIKSYGVSVQEAIEAALTMWLEAEE